MYNRGDFSCKLIDPYPTHTCKGILMRIVCIKGMEVVKLDITQSRHPISVGNGKMSKLYVLWVLNNVLSSASKKNMRKKYIRASGWGIMISE